MLIPELYSKVILQQRKDSRAKLDEYLHLLHFRPDGNDVVLDIGCGTGDVTWDVLRPRLPSTARILGVDIAEDMIKYGAKNYPNIEYDVLDAGTENVPEKFCDMFDHIFSFYCFNWVPNQRQLMKNLYKMLKSGGDMLIMYLARHPIFDVNLEIAEKEIWKPYCQDVKQKISPFQKIDNVEEELQKMLQEVGFNTAVCECKQTAYEFENLQLLQELMIAVNPFFERIPTNLKNVFISDYLDHLQDKVNDENNKESTTQIKLTYRLITIVAHKPSD